MAPIILTLAMLAGDPAAVALLERAQARTPLSDNAVISAEGQMDLAARFQGTRADRPEWVPATEIMVIDGNTLTYEYRAQANADADEYLRFQYDGSGHMLIVDQLNQNAFRVPAERDSATRYRRTDPAFLIADALAHAESLEHLGPATLDGNVYTRVRYTTADTPITLYLDAQARLHAAAYPLAHPVLGSIIVTWRFNAGGYEIHLGDRPYKRMRYVQRQLAPLSADIAIPPPTPPQPEADAPPVPAPLPVPRALADGIHLVPGIRGGFHVMLVEFDDHFVAIDAPAGYFELQMIPPVNWAGDVAPGDIGRRYLDVARGINPDKPVRYVVLTHHHGDHMGDVAAFVAAGATVVGTAETRSVVELVAPGAPYIEVDERMTLGDGDTAIELIDVGTNPHADGMLVVWLPGQRLLYTSDLFEPIPMPMFPNAARVPVMRWFVHWIDNSGLDPERIYAVHGSARVTEEQLQAIRDID